MLVYGRLYLYYQTRLDRASPTHPLVGEYRCRTAFQLEQRRATKRAPGRERPSPATSHALVAAKGGDRPRNPVSRREPCTTVFPPPFPDRDATGAVHAHWIGTDATNLLSKRHEKATPFHVASRHCALATISRSGRHRRCPRALDRDERNQFQFVFCSSKGHGKPTPFHVASRHCVLATIS